MDKAPVMGVLRIGGAYSGCGSVFKFSGPFMALAVRDQSAKHQFEFTSNRLMAPHYGLNRWNQLTHFTQEWDAEIDSSRTSYAYEKPDALG